MKLGRIALALSMALAMGSFAYAAEEKKADEKKPVPKFTEGSCCDKAQKAGKECDKCCADATKEGKVCTKCNKPKEG